MGCVFEISKNVGINEKDIIFAEVGSYYGGHLEHSVEKFEDGYIGITNDSIIFEKQAFRKNIEKNSVNSYMRKYQN